MNIRELADEAAKYSALMALPTGQSGNELFVTRFAELVAAHEREECAKLCEAEADDGSEGEWDGCCLSLANKIRARSKA